MERRGVSMLNLLKIFIKEEDGQGLAEYGLILALVALAVITALTGLGDGIEEIFNDIVGKLNVESGS